MYKQQEQLLATLQQKKMVKVISGIDNFDLDRIGQIIRAAALAGAGSVDVAARPDIVKLARHTSDLPVFASSINPQDLAIAASTGAHVAEIGNFDALYKDGFYLSAEEVVKLTEKTQALLPKETLLSVTIPGYLSTEAQVLLAKRLESMGVTMLQTEGASRVITMTKEVQLLSAEEKALLTFENTAALCQAVTIPVMTASGIDAHNVQEAFAMGAAAVGIGSAVNRLADEEDMLDVLTLIMNQVNAFASTNAVALAS